jgi:hypothetical protein
MKKEGEQMSVKISWEGDGGWVDFTDSYGGYDDDDLDLDGVPWSLMTTIGNTAEDLRFSKPFVLDLDEDPEWRDTEEDFEEAKIEHAAWVKTLAAAIADPSGDNEDYESNLNFLFEEGGLLEVEVSSEGHGGEAHMNFSCDLDGAAWENLKKSNPDITKEMKKAGFVVAREEEL